MSDEESFWERAILASRIGRSLSNLDSAIQIGRVYAGDEGQSASVANSTISATLSRVVTGVSRVVKHSWLYQWLTKEPDPEVIVIDLRETKTVSPVITILDWGATVVETAVEDSRITGQTQRLLSAIREAPMRVAGTGMIGLGIGLGTITLVVGAVSPIGLGLTGLITLSGLVAVRDTRPLDELVESRTVKLLKTILEPPEPPDGQSRHGETDAAETGNVDSPDEEKHE